MDDALSINSSDYEISELDDAQQKLHAGHLMKLSSNGKKWQKRWFTLYSDSSMRYSSKETSSTTKGYIYIESAASVHRNVILSTPPSFVIDIVTEERTWHLAATSERDVQKWLNVLQGVRNISEGNALKKLFKSLGIELNLVEEFVREGILVSDILKLPLEELKQLMPQAGPRNRLLHYLRKIEEEEQKISLEDYLEEFWNVPNSDVAEWLPKDCCGLKTDLEKETASMAPDLDDDFSTEQHLHITKRDYDETKDGADSLLQTIRDSIIGSYAVIETPFGNRTILYADYTASGKPLSFIEDYIRDVVMPFYANTHTEASFTGLQTQSFRKEARDIVLKSCGGDPGTDSVIFAGAGATGAINTLVKIIGFDGNQRNFEAIRSPYSVENVVAFEDVPDSETERPIVLICLYEHHSNELVWRESSAEVVTIGLDEDGRFDLSDLERRCAQYHKRKVKIGSFSACSNVSGVISPVHEIASILHKFGFFAFFDYAGGGPYLPINMTVSNPNENNSENRNLDAVFLSPHKFIGGPQTPGVLLVKKFLCRNPVPSAPAGGTVKYVNPETQKYYDAPEVREEGGTPAIIESIRCGLVFQLKDSVSAETIMENENAHLKHFFDELDYLTKEPQSDYERGQLVFYGPRTNRVGIVSFNIKFREKALHQNFVVTLLNDLFGIQARGGCSCASTYGHYLLNVELELSTQFMEDTYECGEVAKPGWARINLNFFISNGTLDFIIDAIKFITTDGWGLLPLYNVSSSGLWTHNDFEDAHNIRCLKDLSLKSGKMESPNHRKSGKPLSRRDCLQYARSLVSEVQPSHISSSNMMIANLKTRFFWMPEEINDLGTV